MKKYLANFIQKSMNRFIHNASMILAVFFITLTSCQSNTKVINMAGNWGFSLDSADIGLEQSWFNKTLSGDIALPGTTDDAGVGVANQLEPKLERPQILRLTRKNAYLGAAWYQKKVVIPSDWKKKNITLKLGRVLWESRVWVDGQPFGSKESLVTPHYYNLSEALTPGEHVITIRIDNRKRHEISVREMAHSYTNETQIIWNGIIGEITLSSSDPVFVDNIQVYPDVDQRICRVFTTVNNSTGTKVSGSVKLSAGLMDGTNNLPELDKDILLEPGESTIELNYPMGENMKEWDEFNPNLYSMTASITGHNFTDVQNTSFGMRKLTNKDAKLQINGRRLFLRGTLECCIFPLTGHPPMDKEGWLKVFTTAREWGLNHLRFHSWCPPEAAFAVADELGFYLQVELPVWTLNIGSDMPTVAFLKEESNHIIHEFGNHPSFCFWTLGNELQGDFGILENILLELKGKDQRHLYCTTAYTFQAGHGQWPEPNDDYFTTQITKKGWVRGQGLFDSEKPSFDKKYTTSIEGLPAPIITHEIGQYAVFPNLSEIDKYTGVLLPLNFMAVRDDMTKKGLIDRADDYLKATGMFAYILYKEEIERAIKSNGVSGYQLLDLHDFPGQGTALVGLLDAFWDSKGVVTSDEFRQFSAPVVPFANFPKAVYTNDETFTAQLAVSNYSHEPLSAQQIEWVLNSTDGAVIGKGSVGVPELQIGANSELGEIGCALDGIKEASKLRLQLKMGEYSNGWDLWVYPKMVEVNAGEVVITKNFAEAASLLKNGKKVLFNPDYKKVKGLEGKFVPVFWSPVHFPNQAGTMGLLCDPAHEAFRNFPTDSHSNWQWWDLCKQSRVVSLDDMPGATPILINIDNFNRNSSLSSIFETKIGEGKLLFCSMDLSSELNARPVAKQLLYSLITYMNSDTFNPKEEAPIGSVKALINNLGSDIDRGSIYDN